MEVEGVEDRSIRSILLEACSLSLSLSPSLSSVIRHAGASWNFFSMGREKKVEPGF